MPDLVPEVAEQRPVALTEREPRLLPEGGVGLGDVERDEAGLLADHDLLFTGNVLLEREREAARLLGARLDRQPERQQLVDQPSLGLFDPDPGVLGGRLGQIRDHVIEATRATEAVRVGSGSAQLQAPWSM